MILEGVQYYRFRVYFTTKEGKRRRWIRWSPAGIFLRDEVSRELVATFGADGIKPGSVSFHIFHH